MSGLVKTARRLFSGERKEGPDKLGQVGLKVLTDEKLEYRLGQLRLIADEIDEVKQARVEGKSPREALGWYLERCNVISRQLNEVCIPWGRAGDDSRYAGVVSGWSTLHVRTAILLEGMIGYLDHLERGDRPGSVARSDSEKHEIVIKARYFFLDIFIRYAERIMGYSWFDKDVSGNWIATVQMPFMAPGGSPIPQGYPPGGYPPLEAKRREEG